MGLMEPVRKGNDTKFLFSLYSHKDMEFCQTNFILGIERHMMELFYTCYNSVSRYVLLTSILQGKSHDSS